MKRSATPEEINVAFDAFRKRKGSALTIEELKALDAELARVIERDDLEVDRKRLDGPECGILIRARVAGVWCPTDLAHLDRESVLRWLRSGGGSNPLAENCVLVLLGHEPV